MIDSIKRQIWPLVLVAVFYFVPIQFLANLHPVILVQDESTRILLITFLVVSLVFGAAALVFVGLTLATILRRTGRPSTISDLRRTARFAACAGALGLPVVAAVLALTNPLYALVYGVLVGFYLLYAIPLSRRRIGYRSAVTVRCTPEAAYALISDPHNWPRYLPELQVMEPIDSPLRVGSVVSERATIGKRIFEGQDLVTVVEPNRRLGTRGVSTPGSVDLYELRPVDEGTEIAYSAEHLLGLPEAVIGAVFARGANRRLLLSKREAAMQSIKQILEAPPASTV